jgi:large subunit ribosomal protein L35
MGYKLKPNKGAAKRLRVTGTGKLKHYHSLTSHLRSGRSAAKKRHLRRASILDEGHARRFRKLMLVSALKPGAIRHERELKARQQQQPAEQKPTQAG